jgi:hypothetical protein
MDGLLVLLLVVWVVVVIARSYNQITQGITQLKTGEPDDPDGFFDFLSPEQRREKARADGWTNLIAGVLVPLLLLVYMLWRFLSGQ